MTIFGVVRHPRNQVFITFDPCFLKVPSDLRFTIQGLFGRECCVSVPQATTTQQLQREFRQCRSTGRRSSSAGRLAVCVSVPDRCIDAKKNCSDLRSMSSVPLRVTATTLESPSFASFLSVILIGLIPDFAVRSSSTGVEQRHEQQFRCQWAYTTDGDASALSLLRARELRRMRFQSSDRLHRNFPAIRAPCPGKSLSVTLSALLSQRFTNVCSFADTVEM